VQLHRHREEFDGRLWLVGMGTPAHAQAFKDETGVELPVLLSPDKKAYEAMDLKRGSTAQVFSPRGALKSLARARHQPTRMPEQDWHQLGGTFVIAPGGKVVFAHRGAYPGDEPDVSAIAAALG
jgi:hypothetical protein